MALDPHDEADEKLKITNPDFARAFDELVTQAEAGNAVAVYDGDTD